MNFLKALIKIFTMSPPRYMGQKEKADITPNINSYTVDAEDGEDSNESGYRNRYRLSEDEREDIEEDYP